MIATYQGESSTGTITSWSRGSLMEKSTKEFRNALGMFATGVTVVTTADAAGSKYGMTANSFNSLSLDPMLVLWSIAKTSSSFDIFNQADHFAIHVLNVDQQAISDQFSSKTGDRFAGIDCLVGHGNVPLVPDCAAVFECDTEHRYDGGDHIILVGRVIKFDYRENLEPLIFHSGHYSKISA